MSRNLAARGAAIAACTAAGGFLLGLISRGTGWREVLVFVVGAALAALVGYAAFWRPARAIATVTEAAGRLAEGELAQRVPDEPGPAGELTRAFNLMSGRIETLFESVAYEHARLEAVFDASSDPMVALARDTRIRFLNPAAVALFGTTMADALGRPLIEVARDYEIDALVRAAGTSRFGQTAIISFGPARTPLRAAALPIREGGEWAVLLILTDLTEVQRLDRVRRDFVSNVSHELRTPLASIRALVETLDSGVDPEDQPEFHRRILRQVDRLTLLVNELLDLSRIESGAIQLRPESIPVGDLIAEAASLLQDRTEAAGVTIIAEGTDLSLEADRSALLRVIGNLLDNAVKWSPPGGRIWVAAADEGDLIAITVRDEGPGIPEQDLPRVFERFFKSDAARAGGGVGLGLAIVKHLVRAHGGTVTAESPPGQGATFTVRLPRRFVGRARVVPGA
ncbi:ATP-binding protein [Tepidiforma sp.]|uniref:HAMP domain-containing sensor histidine kinase n=1 Tax=Tepidiforma sp. TaxID=2682230 RepID=UPI002ADE71BD|nr:ATP-binding protein [Tepidiforma sp.]